MVLVGKKRWLGQKCVTVLQERQYTQIKPSHCNSTSMVRYSSMFIACSRHNCSITVAMNNSMTNIKYYTTPVASYVYIRTFTSAGLQTVTSIIEEYRYIVFK